MRKEVKPQTNRSGKKVWSNSVNRIQKKLKNPGTNTALELVEVYEAVERTYRAAVMAGETRDGVAYSTNFQRS